MTARKKGKTRPKVGPRNRKAEAETALLEQVEHDVGTWCSELGLAMDSSVTVRTASRVTVIGRSKTFDSHLLWTVSGDAPKLKAAENDPNHDDSHDDHITIVNYTPEEARALFEVLSENASLLELMAIAAR